MLKLSLKIWLESENIILLYLKKSRFFATLLPRPQNYKTNQDILVNTKGGISRSVSYRYIDHLPVDISTETHIDWVSGTYIHRPPQTTERWHSWCHEWWLPNDIIHIIQVCKSSILADIKPRYSNQSVCEALELATFMDPRLSLLAVINHTWKDSWTTKITQFRYGDIRSTSSIRYIEGLNNMRYQSYRYIVPPLVNTAMNSDKSVMNLKTLIVYLYIHPNVEKIDMLSHWQGRCHISACSLVTDSFTWDWWSQSYACSLTSTIYSI